MMKRLMVIATLALSWALPAAADVAPVTNKQYQAECSACHMAYPPGLLPARSWQKLMGGLSNHFGDDASLAEQTRQALTEYLVLNAADKSDYRRAAAHHRGALHQTQARRDPRPLHQRQRAGTQFEQLRRLSRERRPGRLQ